MRALTRGHHLSCHFVSHAWQNRPKPCSFEKPLHLQPERVTIECPLRPALTWVLSNVNES